MTSRSFTNKTLLLFVGLSFLIANCSSKTSDARFPAPVGMVNDFADVLTAEEEQDLQSRLEAFERETTNEIAIVTLNELYGEKDLFWCSLNIAREWGIGKKEKNNGVLIALAPFMRGVHIQTGKGLEQQLTDSATQVIIDSVMVPGFKQVGYYEGLSEGVEAIIEVIR
ncbi:MAG: TPM domain-containing protein [Bacteroidia bacterium]|nr:TPM domain-containing protein [Bacteroidia bacterium]